MSGTRSVDAAEVLALLIRQEMALSMFYAEAAVRFPETAPFWRELAREERAHAEVIRELGEGALAASMAHVRTRFNAAAIRTSLEFIEKRSGLLREGSLAVVQALSFAVSMEEALLENKFFEVFTGDGVRMRRELEALAAHTQEHLGRIRALWEAERERIER